MASRDWTIGEVHPVYGRVVAMGIKDGEAWRIFLKKDHTIALIPLPVLQAEEEAPCE